ncbi:SDR family NAD(P)-dependent oxidoreductase [Candidatus Poriferisocius sp.]|uniref:SDR family NAD(P)-dependent oxidoreductase n=1 Tax=Candidatus Poriferisocius sp. TaxID=3101276 RepID=UPI003B5BFFE1
MPVAIVTGASRGIGAGIARRLVAEGCDVACVARTLAEGDSHLDGSLQRTVDRLTEAGGRAHAVVADLSAPDFDAHGLVCEVEIVLGPVDYLVNNAAAAFYPSYLETPRKRMEVSFRVNVVAPWLLAQAVLPGMIERGTGSVLNLTSQTAIMPPGPPFKVAPQIGGATSYGGSKAWLERATVGAAAELYGTGVSLNCLSPDTSVITEGSDALVDLSAYPNEPVDTMAEAAWALLTGDPEEFTGRVEYALSLLHRLQRPVMRLDGSGLLEGWQPHEFDTAYLIAPGGDRP